MNVRRTELLKALKQCLPGIENGKSVLEGVDLFVFSKGFVYSYNDIISVSVPVKSEGLLNEGIEGAVRAEEFHGIINKLNGDLIEFIVENDKWILKSGKAKVELTLMAGDFSERFETIAPDKNKWSEISPEFTQGLGVCKMSNNRSNISGLYITSTDITSSDGFQINQFRYKGAGFEDFWISDDSAGELLKVGILTHIQLKDTWAHFKTVNNTVFSVKTLQAGQWPYEVIQGILEGHKKTKTSVSATFPKELFDAIDRASSFYLDISDSRAVRLSISSKRILVSAERIAGKFEEKVAWGEEPPAFASFELYVDISMILFAARRSMSFYIHEIEDNLPRMIFTTDNSIHLMASLSIDTEEAETETQPARSKKVETKNEIAKSERKKPKVPAMYEEPEEEGEEDNGGRETERLIKNAQKKSTKDANKEDKKKTAPVVDEEDDDDDSDLGDDEEENEDVF